MNTNSLMYVAADGNYGSATNITFIDASQFTSHDYDVLDMCGEDERGDVAAALGRRYDTHPRHAIYITHEEMQKMRMASMAGDHEEAMNVLRDAFNRSFNF